MSRKFIRVYRQTDVLELQKRLLICGDLSAQCANCQAIDLGFDDRACPKCEAVFTHIAFRNVKNHLPKMLRLNQERPDVVLVDYDDYKRCIGEFKAKEFLK